MSYSSIAWLPLAAGLTVLGLLLTYSVWRRGGIRAALRPAAISLLPIAAYMTGAIEMLWKIGAAIGQFGTGFVFSPMKWVGVGVTGLAILLFLAAGGREGRRAAREARRAARAKRKDEAEAATAGDQRGALEPSRTPATRAMPADRTPVPVPATRKTDAAPAKSSRKAAPPDDDDDLKDIEDILRKRGI